VLLQHEVPLNLGSSMPGPEPIRSIDPGPPPQKKTLMAAALYRLCTSLVVPPFLPIAWVSTSNSGGKPTGGPFRFFNCRGDQPRVNGVDRCPARSE